MTAGFPLPDARLDGMVTLEQFLSHSDGLHVTSNGQPNGSEPQPDAKNEISRLAKLNKLDYERERKAAAKRLGFRTPALDRIVAGERTQFDDSSKQGRALILAEPEPWPEPINGARLLDEIAASIRRYVAMTDHAADASALWVLHTYLLNCFGISPRLAITSPEKGCGKTTLLDVLSHLVMRSLPAANTSAAAIFRVVEMQQPTLLIDEADTFLSENEELRGILNSGHRQGGLVLRVVGEDFEPRAFSTYSACAIALIGKLPGTLADRSVPIDLRRRRPDEAVEGFRFDRTRPLDQIARKAARWAMDHADQVRGADPVMPAGMFNRAADNWRPLLAIADAAGGSWPARARAAIKSLMLAGEADQSIRVTLLGDIRAIFAEGHADRLSSAELIAALIAIEGRPWAEWKAGKAITANNLARLLAPFAIQPGTIRTNDGTPKGYHIAQFQDAFTRYLPGEDY
jgi:putative DNA primase/helicase